MLLETWPDQRDAPGSRARSPSEGEAPGSGSDAGWHRQEGTEDLERTVVGVPEFPVYAALKLFLCERILRGQASTDGLDLFQLTVRRIHYLLVRRGCGPQFPELFHVSPYFLRERLKTLKHDSVLQAGDSRGMRKAVIYNWREPLGASDLDAYRRLVSLLGEDVRYAMDLYRIEGAFGTDPFTETQYLELMGKWRARTLGRGGRGPGLSSKRVAFRVYLRERLHTLVRLRLVEQQGQRFRLTPQGRQATHWFDLFVHSVDYAGGRS